MRDVSCLSYDEILELPAIATRVFLIPFYLFIMFNPIFELILLLILPNKVFFETSIILNPPKSFWVVRIVYVLDV